MTAAPDTQCQPEANELRQGCEPVAWIVKWATKHTPENASAYLNEKDANRAAANVKMYADASNIVVIPTFASAAQEAEHCGDQSHDSRVYFMCESCEEHNPEGAVGPRSDIAVMPDGTWLCDGCYSDCDKSAYGLIASDVDDFVFPRFEDLPRPAPYGAPSVPSAQGNTP